MGGYIERISGEIADIILREGIDYTQTKAVISDHKAQDGDAKANYRGNR